MGMEALLENEARSGPIPPLDLRKVLNRAAEDLSRAIDAETCFIYLVSQDQVMLPMLATSGVNPDNRRLFFDSKLDASNDLLAAILMTNPATFLSNQVQQDARILPSIATALGAEALVATSVQSHARTIAIVMSVRYRRGHPFTHQQVTLAETVGAIIALALENAQVSEDMRMRLQESQSLHQITLALLQKLDLDEVIEIICKEALRMSRASGSLIGLLEDSEWIRIAHSAGDFVEPGGRFPLMSSNLGMAV
ncbi:GAF domain-containing protein, partial [bacterium]|nr:GAF domain-containing protein [bacterium]